MGTSSDLMIGETVIAIGNPFGLNHTVTTGVVSATGPDLRAEDRVYRDFIQTDASINPGNSGGPLLNINGSLIGINTAIYGGKAQNIGFTIPIDRARRIVDDLIRFGAVVPAWLGVEVQDLSGNLAESFDFPLRSGALVSEVVEDGPAEAGGLQRGDIITALGSDSVQIGAGLPGEPPRLHRRRRGAGDLLPRRGREAGHGAQHRVPCRAGGPGTVAPGGFRGDRDHPGPGPQLQPAGPGGGGHPQGP